MAPDFRMVSATSRVSFDVHAGSQMIETSADGGSLLWYTVLMCVPSQSIDFVGCVSAKYGGTLLCISDAIVGHVKEDSLARLESGWMQLFRDGLKAHVEKNA